MLFIESYIYQKVTRVADTESVRDRSTFKDLCETVKGNNQSKSIKKKHDYILKQEKTNINESYSGVL